MYRLTIHARQQIESRGVTSESEVLATIASKLERIEKINYFEIRVIVKRLPHAITLPDGSNGDTILACLDPVRQTVKTVMVQRSSQVTRKAAQNHNYV